MRRHRVIAQTRTKAGASCRVTLLALTAITAMALLAAGCSASPDIAGSGGSGGGGIYGEMFQWIPDDEATRGLTMATNMDRLAEAGGLVRPDCENASDDELTDYFRSTFTLNDGDNQLRLGTPPSVWQRAIGGIEADAFRSQAGFTPCETIAFAEGGDFRTAVFQVSVSADQIGERLAGDPEFGPLLEQVSYRDLDYWTFDLESLGALRASPARMIGEPTALAAVGDDLLLRSRYPDDLEPALSAGSNGRGLGAEEDVGLIIEILDDLDALAIGVAYPASSNASAIAGPFASQEALDEITEALAETPRNMPLSVVGWGHTHDGESFGLTLLMVHADAETATANLERFARVIDEGESYRQSRPWSEQFQIVDSRTTGRVSVFELSDPDGEAVTGSVLPSVILSRDLLFLADR